MATEQITQTEFTDIAQASKLRMGRAWQSVGMINQALSVYEQLLADHPDTTEARGAAESMLSLAQAFEREGHYHRAMDLYDKLERLS